MNYNNICYRCFTEKPIIDRVCPDCGYSNSTPQLSPNCLPAGTLIHNRYLVGIALGVGGFGITYKCMDIKLGGICAIKEYFPTTCNPMRSVDGRTVMIQDHSLEKYNKIMKRFNEEAELLKTLEHRNVIKVYDSFFENNTAYYVMEYCDGIDLRHYTGQFTRMLSYNEGINIMYQVMNGLEYIHRQGILHRDIAPDNIFITKNNIVKILDFGSARHEMDQMNRNLSVIVKMGYAPVEQYGKSKQGAYTDVYALGATFYHLFSGKSPLESTQRVAEDALIPFSKLRPDLPDELKFCIERAMAIRVSDRIKDIPEMKKILGLEHIKTADKEKKGPVKVETGTGSGEQRGTKSSTITGQRTTAPATISARLCAYMLDLLIYGTIYSSAVLLAVPDSTYALMIWCLFPALFTVINIITEMISQVTLGKGIMRLTVADENGYKPTAYQVVLRNIIKMLGCIGLLFINNNQALEDRLTNTKVYSKK